MTIISSACAKRWRRSYYYALCLRRRRRILFCSYCQYATSDDYHLQQFRSIPLENFFWIGVARLWVACCPENGNAKVCRKHVSEKSTGAISPKSKYKMSNHMAALWKGFGNNVAISVAMVAVFVFGQHGPKYKHAKIIDRFHWNRNTMCLWVWSLYNMSLVNVLPFLLPLWQFWCLINVCGLRTENSKHTSSYLVINYLMMCLKGP